MRERDWQAMVTAAAQHLGGAVPDDADPPVGEVCAGPRP